MPEPLLRPADGGSVARQAEGGGWSGAVKLGPTGAGFSPRPPNLWASAYVGPAKLGLSKAGVRLWSRAISRDPGIRTVPETPSACRPQGT